MQRRVLVSVVAGLAVAALVVTSVADAQERRGRGPGGRGPGGFGQLDFENPVLLLRSDAVKRELDLTTDQEEQINEVLAGLQPGGGRGAGPEAIQQARQQREEARAKLEETLLAHQQERLQQIGLQLAGASALARDEVAAKLELSDEQRQQVQQVLQESAERTQQLFQGGFQQGQRGQRGQIQERLAAAREETEQQLLAVLTDEQKADFEQLKGEPANIQLSDVVGGFGGRAGAGGFGGGQRRGGGGFRGQN